MQGDVFSTEANSRSWRPFVHQSLHEVRSEGPFTLVANHQCVQDSVVNVGPTPLVPFTCGLIKHGLTAGRVCCESRVRQFDRTGKFDTTGFPFGCLVSRSYPETFMKHVSQFEGIVFSKSQCFTPTLVMLMCAITTKGIEFGKFFEVSSNGPTFLHGLTGADRCSQELPSYIHQNGART